MNNGALVYHVEVLEREGLLRSRADGMYRRFYTMETPLPPLLENGTSEVQLRVLRAIGEMPGITQKELARVLGLRQSTLAYQVEKLTAMGYIAGEKQGRRVHYTAKKKAN
jgi:predicted transcriptional regulator